MSRGGFAQPDVSPCKIVEVDLFIDTFLKIVTVFPVTTVKVTGVTG